MASMKRILKNLQAFRVFFYAPSRSSAHRQLISTSREALKWKNYGGSNSEWCTDTGRLHYILPAILAGSFVGSPLSPLVYAESPSTTQSDTGSGTELDPHSQNVWMEKTVRKVRESLEERMRNKGLQRGAYPSFIVAVKGQQVSIKFRTSQSSQLSNIVADLLLHLGQGSQDRGACEVKIQALDSASNKKVLLIFPKGLKDPMHGGFLSEEEPGGEGELHVLISESGIGSSNIEFEFVKQGLFSTEDLEALARSLETASNLSEGRKEIKSKVFSERRDSTNGARVNVDKKSLSELESMGVKVFGLDWADEDSGHEVISWDIVAGYEKQKREIEDTILLALNKPEVYDTIAHGTRYKFESNRPRAVLFEGPPGTGKTSCARVIANQAHVPLLYVPLEVVMSKYYGESERLLGTVFNLANELSNGAIVFLDEVDSFAATRDNEMHEATRRILSVLLRQIDGFEQEKRVVVIAATNRKQDLDPALISRFDSVITFGLPDQPDRQKIVAKYAKHLDKNELVELSVALEGMSGRDIRDVCLQAERRWASKIIREQIPNDKSKNDLPPIDEYLDSAADRRGTMFDIEANSGHPTLHSKNQKMAFSS